MKVYTDLAQVFKAPPSAVALGMFDGVHLGHQKVIRAAFQQGLSPSVLTFTTHHQRPTKKIHQRDILTMEERIQKFEQLGVERVYIPDFDSLKEMEATYFISQVLDQRLHARFVCCGEDFRFGRFAAGDVSLLKQVCGELGIEVCIVPPQLDEGIPVSSTRIRLALQQGDVIQANRLLGYPYAIKGEVVHGYQLGRTIQCPTLNQELSESLCLPLFGVYASLTWIEGKKYPSITNVGIKPTIKGNRQPLAETHVIGIDQDLYGQQVTVELYRMIRTERKFDSIQQLSDEIHRNIQTAQHFFKQYKGLL